MQNDPVQKMPTRHIAESAFDAVYLTASLSLAVGLFAAGKALCGAPFLCFYPSVYYCERFRAQDGRRLTDAIGYTSPPSAGTHPGASPRLCVSTIVSLYPSWPWTLPAPSIALVLLAMPEKGSPGVPANGSGYRGGILCPRYAVVKVLWGKCVGDLPSYT